VIRWGGTGSLEMPLSETKQQEGSDMSTPIEPNPFVPPRLTVALSAVWLAMALSLSACGGGSAAVESSPVTLSRLAQGGSAPGPASASDQALLAKGAQLNQASLDAAEAQAQAAAPSRPKAPTPAARWRARPPLCAFPPTGSTTPERARTSTPPAKKSAPTNKKLLSAKLHGKMAGGCPISKNCAA
jgi:hypothetical protein